MRKFLAISVSLFLGLLMQAQAVSFMDDIGKTFSVGGDIRWRYVTTKNILDLNDDVGINIDTAKYYRNRIRLWTKLGIADNVSATVRIAAEPWWGSYLKNDTSNRWPLEFDNAFLEVKDAFVKGLNVKLGRQDIIYGTGFMILDGTPVDGSRTIFHDGAKLSYLFNERTMIDLFGAILEEGDYGYDDDWDIQGLYLTSRDVFGALPEHKLELYVLRSHQGLDNAPQRPDPLAALQAQISTLTARLATLEQQVAAAPANTNTRTGVSDNIIAPGIRLSGSIGNELVAYASEAMFQTGGTDTVNRQGLGYYAQLTLNPGAKVQAIEKYAPKLRGSYYFMSGDNPTTSQTNEGLFHFTSLSPKYSVLYMYTLLTPPVISKWGEPDWLSNMTLVEGQLSFKPARMLVLTGRLGRLGAEYARVGEGTHRGTLIHVRADYALSQNIFGQVLSEWFLPGDYYTVDGVEADAASFLRVVTSVIF